MKMQKLAFFRAAPAPWQTTPPGGPVKKGGYRRPCCHAPLDFSNPR